MLTLDKEATSRFFRTSNFSAWSYACLCKISLSASGIHMEASAASMPLGSVQVSGAGTGAGASATGASEHVLLRSLLLSRRTGRPRSMTEDSDMFLLCDEAMCAVMGSRFSVLGEPRRSSAPGEQALKGLDMADRGVGSGPFTLGDLLDSSALEGVVPPLCKVEGVLSCVLLDFGLSLRGLGEPLRSVGRSVGDLGGTSGRRSDASLISVSTFNDGFVPTPGLRIGDNGLPSVLEISVLLNTVGSRRLSGVFSSVSTGEGPVMQDIRALPKGSVLQFVPGALLDRSWPKASIEGFFRAGRPGMVAIGRQLDGMACSTWTDIRESMAISWTVVIVLLSSGTLTFRLLESEPLRCQKGTLSGWAAVSLNEVEERTTARAESLSEEWLGRMRPTGLLDICDGQSWNLVELVCDARLMMEGDDGTRSLGSLPAWRFFSDLDRRGRW